MARNTTRRVPVINGGGSVHVDFVVGDLRSITVNGGEVNHPDTNGNINILVPEKVEVETSVIEGSDAVPTGGAVYAEMSEVRGTLAEHRGYINRLSADMGNVLDTLDAQDATIADLNATLGGKMDKGAVSVISETEYAMLEHRGTVDANKIYFVYEDEAVTPV